MARIAGEFAATYMLDGIQGLWIRPRGNGFEIVCHPGQRNIGRAREEVEALATEVAAQLAFGTPVDVVFLEREIDDTTAVRIGFR